MSATSDILFKFLRDVIYEPAKASLDLNSLEADYLALGKGLIYFAQCFSQYNEFAKALAKGDLSVPPPPPENELAAPLKMLHASLKHLTWQSQQVAKGDYKQRVDFMGSFSDAFNIMTEQLAERQQKLEQEIETTRNKSMALEQSNQLLTNITQHITQQIIVIERDTRAVLFLNDAAQRELDVDATYLDRVSALLPARGDSEDAYAVEVRLDEQRYLAVNAYLLEWDHLSAEAFVIDDISEEKRQIQELENHAYLDSMTHTYNRLYGMRLLGEWIEERRVFSLVFVDLDNLKYVNDRYGHREGDRYIINVARHLMATAEDVVVCRLGGDEFMLLFPGNGYEDVHNRIIEVSDQIHHDEYLQGKAYYYSVSYGIVAVTQDNTLTASEIIGLADERMYEYKRRRKKARLG